MNRLLWKKITGGVAAVTIFALAVILSKQPQAEPLPPTTKTTVTIATTQAVTTTTTITPVASVYCYLGEHQGQLAVYESDGTNLREVYDVYIATLPEEEQARLKAKIPVTNETELAQLLEDYTS